MYDELTVALDGSLLATHAAAYAATLPSRRYRLVHVEPPFARPATRDRRNTRSDWHTVVSTRAMTGLPRLLLGSFAERLVRGAPAPVILVHERMSVESVSAQSAPPARAASPT